MRLRLGSTQALLLALVATLLALLALSGCAPAEEQPLAWVTRMSVLQGQATMAMANNDVQRALQALTDIADGAAPPSIAPADLRVIRQDACYQLGLLTYRQGDPELARRWVEQGLHLGRANDLFTANLLTLRGQLFQIQGRDAEAVNDYHAALVINEGLLNESDHEPSPSDGGAP
jgi:tetratricopeptide (TPR) repeat protein